MSEFTIELMKDNKTIYIHQNGNDFFIPIETLEKIKTKASTHPCVDVKTPISPAARLKSARAEGVKEFTKYDPEATWKVKDGTPMKIADMDTHHIQNAMRMYMKKTIEFSLDVSLCNPMAPLPVQYLRGELLRRRGYL